ncbi:hypothetical protein NIES4106_41200 [Fischerella sp. NIES-4106]|nr:hypothetical protein NIES4106_41200 [Fischerella sp. NIES-4106]
MIQAIDLEQAFVTNLEIFMGKADKFIKVYYAGVSEEKHLKEIMLELQKLVMDADLQQLEIDYQQHCEEKDLMSDCEDSAWWETYHFHT